METTSRYRTIRDLIEKSRNASTMAEAGYYAGQARQMIEKGSR